MKLLAIVVLALLTPAVFGAPIIIKSLLLPVLDPGPADPEGPVMRECSYTVDDQLLSNLPRYDPVSGANLLPPHLALAAAFSVHDEKQGVTKDDFYRMATITLEKIDDYTLSSTAGEVRRHGRAVRETWFYVVSCTWPATRRFKDPPAPVVVLMNGDVVSSVERRKYLQEK